MRQMTRQLLTGWWYIFTQHIVKVSMIEIAFDVLFERIQVAEVSNKTGLGKRVALKYDLNGVGVPVQATALVTFG